jgi:heat shock protein HtpX
MRFLLLILTNLAVSMMLGLVFFGLEAAGYLPRGQTGTLAVYAVLFGFGGSFFSLLISKPMAKWSMGVQVVDTPRTELEQWLVSTVREHATRAGIRMPEVGIYDSPDPNAFATGWSKDSSLVAVSTGLIQSMTREQASAVLGHEVAHAANGDMVTLTLVQGVLNTFVLFFSRIIAFAIDSALSRGDDRESRGPSGVSMILVFVLQLVLGLVASMIVAWFSRRREFRADEGGAKLTSPRAMAGALAALRRAEGADLPASMSAFGIHGNGLMRLFSTHPPIEERIERLMRVG